MGSSVAISFIRRYQRLAPAGLRAACRFSPCCSEFTIRAIQKYGVLRGSTRGIRRLLRCRPPNGGPDEP